MDNLNLESDFLVGNVVKSEITDMGDIRLYYVKPYEEKYTVLIKANRDGDLYCSNKTPAPYAIYNTNTSGEPTTKIAQLFEWDLEYVLRLWNVPREDIFECTERIINGDRFYGGASTNQAVIMRRIS